MTAEPAPPSGSSHIGEGHAPIDRDAPREALDGEGGEACAGLTLRSPRRRRTAAAHHNAFGNCGVPLAAGRGVLLIFKLADLLHAVVTVDRWKMRVSLP